MNSVGISVEDLRSDQPRGVCPSCHRAVAFWRRDRRTVFPEIEKWPNASGADFSGVPGSAVPAGPTRQSGARWKVDEYVLECQPCGKTCVLFAYWGPDTSAWSDPPTSEELKKTKVRVVKLVHPSQTPRELHKAAPEKVRSLFREGANCEAIGTLRAAAGMYRAAVEELCDDRQAPGKNLFEKIDGLASRGVSAEIVADLHEARMLGNWSLHDGITFSSDEVADVALLIEEAVTLVYVQAEERAAMRAARKARRDENRKAKESQKETSK